MARVRLLARSSLTVLCIVGLMAVGSAPAGVGNPIVEQVSGGGETTFEIGPITIVYQWEVIAQERFDGSASGDAWISETFPGFGYRINTVEIQCLRVEGDIAIVSGLITSTVGDLPSTTGLTAFWAIEDRGNGAGEDQVHWYQFTSGVDPATWCLAWEPLAARWETWDRGNFRVR